MAGHPDPPQLIQNLLVNIPPGTAKSRIVSVFAPAWMWLHCPSWRAIFISANPRVALRDSVYCRMLLESAWYRQRFGISWTFAADQNAKGLYRNSAGGFRMAIGVGSRITGDRADALFIDDPNDAKEVQSQAYRAGVNEWYDQGAGNRVNDLQISVRIGIMQRLHEDDWSGHVLRSGQWVHLVLPMEFDPERGGATVIGWTDPRRAEGELLFPQRFPPKILAAEKVRLGEAGYAGQHQQAPAPKDGLIFKAHWFENRYRTLPELTDVCTIWDTALKAGQENDESASLTLGTGPDGNPYLVSLTHGRSETPELAEMLMGQADLMRSLFGGRVPGRLCRRQRLGHDFDAVCPPPAAGAHLDPALARHRRQGRAGAGRHAAVSDRARPAARQRGVPGRSRLGAGPACTAAFVPERKARRHGRRAGLRPEALSGRRGRRVGVHLTGHAYRTRLLCTGLVSRRGF